MDDIESKRPESPIGTRYSVCTCFDKIYKITLKPLDDKYCLVSLAFVFLA